MDEARQPYRDIIDLTHHVSHRHTPMSAAGRAAQFAPFAALSGYDDMISEAARFTDAPPSLGEDEREELDRRLIFLLHRETPTQAVFTYFVPDRKKEGGAYVRAAAVLLRYDACRQCLLLSGGLTVPTAHLAWIACDAFDTWEKSEDSGTI